MDISLPGNLEFWINLILQRTSYLLSTKEGSTAFQKWCNNGDIQAIAEICEDKAWKKEFATFVLKEAKDEAIQIAEYLKNKNSKISSICSIGPGNGFIELYLCKILSPKSLLLIDIEETPGRHHHAFHSEGSGYCSLDETKKFLLSNLSENKTSDDQLIPTITCCNPKKHYLPNYPADLTISLLSAGFHYPIKSYYDFLKYSMTRDQKETSYLIFDARNEIPHDLDFLRDDGEISRTKKSIRKILAA